jgi:hypothetical protein
MEQFSEDTGQTVPRVHSGVPATTARSRSPQWRRILQAGVGVGVAAGVAIGAAALAGAATSGGTTPKSSTTPSTAKPGAKWAQGGHFAGRGFGGTALGGPGGGFGLGFGGSGSVLHGEETVSGPNGYETIEFQTGTVTSVTDVSGSTWSLVVTSADKTALTYTVNSGSSVNGGESGISSVKSGNKVSVVAVVSKGTATVKTLMDATTLQANRGTWAPKGPGGPISPPAAPSSGSATSSS